MADNAIADKILNYLVERPNQGISITELAEVTGLDARKVSTSISNSLRRSPNETWRFVHRTSRGSYGYRPEDRREDEETPKRRQGTKQTAKKRTSPKQRAPKVAARATAVPAAPAIAAPVTVADWRVIGQDEGITILKGADGQIYAARPLIEA